MLKVYKHLILRSQNNLLISCFKPRHLHYLVGKGTKKIVTTGNKQ